MEVFSGILVFLGEEVPIVGDFGVVILDWVEVAFVVHAVESVFLTANMIDEENAVEVIDFVEESAGEEAFGFEANFAAVFEQGFDFDFARATDAAINFRDREAAFKISFGLAFGADDLGVDEGGEVIVGFVFEIIADDNNALVNAELWRSHGGRKLIRMLLFPLEGASNHIANNFAGFVGDFANFGRFET